MSDTRIDSITLENFRCFRQVSVKFHRHLTVLVAQNGQGKTALLDGVRAACAPLISALMDTREETISKADVRRARGSDGGMEVMTPSVIQAEFVLDDRSCSLSLTRRSVAPRAPRPALTSVGASLFAETLRQLKSFANLQRTKPPTLPILAAYGTMRLWSERAIRAGQDPSGAITSRLRGYDEALTPTTSFRAFARWYGKLSQEALAEQTSQRPSPHRPAEKLQAIQAAVQPLLHPTGWDRLTWDFVEGVLAAENATIGRLPVALLSDGIRAMIALVGDIAHRCVRLNPQWGKDAPKQTPGIVLIDEVDLHLHPAWQRHILDSLQEVFPRIQWIVTTHSPHILSTVNAESIRMLHLDHDEGRVEHPTNQTRGVDSAQALTFAMGLDPLPDLPETEKLQRYRRLIEDGEGDSETARALLTELIAHFGEHHPVMVDCARLLRFFRFKQARPHLAQDR